jgi:hypothetical protein
VAPKNIIEYSKNLRWLLMNAVEEVADDFVDRERVKPLEKLMPAEFALAPST